MKRIEDSTLELSAKVFFSLDKYQLKYGLQTLFFAIQLIENRFLYWSAPPPPPRDQSNPFAYSCTFHTTYKNGMIGHGGNDVIMLKNKIS